MEKIWPRLNFAPWIEEIIQVSICTIGKKTLSDGAKKIGKKAPSDGAFMAYKRKVVLNDKKTPVV